MKKFKKPFPKYSDGTYERRFKTWRKALEKFVESINEEDELDEEIPDNIQSENAHKEVTKRNISDRLRFTILMRDGFTCQSWGLGKPRNAEWNCMWIIL